MKKSDVTPIHPLSLKKKLIFTLIVTVISGTLLFSGAEIAVRYTSGLGYVTPEILRQRTLEYAPALFARHIFPQKELRANNEDENNLVEYYINEKGYRGRNFTVPKPQGTIRIIFYGGSATFDVNLPEGRDWPHRVEAILKQNGLQRSRSSMRVSRVMPPGTALVDYFLRGISSILIMWSLITGGMISGISGRINHS